MDSFTLKKLTERNDLINSQRYDKSSDIWFLEAIWCEILGKWILTGGNFKESYVKIKRGYYFLPTHLSKESLSFLNGVLQYNAWRTSNI